jgi:hypothetical protein
MAPKIRVGLQAGWGTSLQAMFPAFATYGFGTIRQDLYGQGDPAAVPALVTECVGAPVRMLFLIGGGHIDHAGGNRIEPHELAAWTTTVVQTARTAGLTDYALEIGNEPDIAHPGYADRPQDFAEAVRQCHEAARANGFAGAVITGGISNLNNRGFRYLSAMLAVPTLPVNDLVFGFHRYPESGRGPLAPHDRFKSREDEWTMLRQLVGARPVACTEFGYHTAKSRPLTLTNSDVADAVFWDLNFFAERLVPLAVVYQLNDGPTDDWIDRYGVRTLDGTWKVVAERMRVAYGTPAV